MTCIPLHHFQSLENGATHSDFSSLELSDWCRFYFNATTGESSWADPRQSVEFDLRFAIAVDFHKFQVIGEKGYFVDMLTL